MKSVSVCVCAICVVVVEISVSKLVEVEVMVEVVVVIKEEVSVEVVSLLPKLDPVVFVAVECTIGTVSVADALESDVVFGEVGSKMLADDVAVVTFTITGAEALIIDEELLLELGTLEVEIDFDMGMDALLAADVITGDESNEDIEMDGPLLKYHWNYQLI